jgi:glycosyltransferase involved in cell wall biosynthesis
LVTIWRVPFLIKNIIENNLGIRKIIIKEFKYFIDDLICIFNVFLIAYFLIHLPRLIKILFKFFRYKIYNTKFITLQDLIFYFKSFFKKLKEKMFGKKQTIQMYNGMLINDNIIPDEILLEIFSNLDGVDIATKVETVCQHWNTVSSDELLWKSLNNNFKTKMVNKGFLGVFKNAFEAKENKSMYVKRYLASKPKKELTPEEKYEKNVFGKGLRNIIHLEAYHNLKKLWKFIFLPLIVN